MPAIAKRHATTGLGVPQVVQVWMAVPLAAYVLFALVLGSIGLGGGIYETLLVDRVWPENPSIIQPSRGGINRALFWAPVHTLYELALLLGAWMVWRDSTARAWMIIAIVAHVFTRAVSFAYFIPRALRFKKAGDLTDAQRQAARRWTRLSPYRLITEAIAIVALGAAILHFGAGTIHA
jgi:hypothetical protein